MTLRAALAILALAACAGCVALSHPRLTVFVERDVADGPRRQRTTTIKQGVSMTCELSQP